MNTENEQYIEAQEKYGDGDFKDPVMRCDSCAVMVFTVNLKKLGMCPDCGNRKVREIRQLSESEIETLKQKNVDPLFLALFEAVETEIEGTIQ